MKGTTGEMTMLDKIEKSGNQLIQHGKHNNRIYLIKFSWETFPEDIPALEQLAIQNGYTKIFAKIPAAALAPFLQFSYQTEAFIPSYYNDGSDCLFVSRFFDQSRKKIPDIELLDFYSLVGNMKDKNKFKYTHSLKLVIRILQPDDLAQVVCIYKKVFQTYPFPIFDKKYLKQNMDDKSVIYFGVFDNQKLIGVSSTEIDYINHNAEMTDFAILPEYRGQNLAFFLLNTMETEMKIINIKTLYTIARLKSPGMNKTFMKSGYKYSGTLANNTNISGQIESMNVFYKHL